MNEEYTIVTSPYKKWKRMSLLLESYTKDKSEEVIERTTEYNTFYLPYDTDLGWYVDSHSCSIYDRDMEEIEKDVLWLQNKIKNIWRVFIDTI